MTSRASLSVACDAALGATLAVTPVQASPASHVALDGSTDYVSMAIGGNDVNLAEDRATGAGFTYVEVRDDSAGHAVCDRPAWVNNLSLPIDESLHPNRAGSADALAIAPQLTGAAMSGGDDLVAQDWTDVEGWTSMADGSRAESKGLDSGRIARAVATLWSDNDRVVRSGLKELQVLDAQFSARG